MYLFHCIIMFLTYLFCQMNFYNRRVDIKDDTYLPVDCMACKMPQKGREILFPTN
jgi:hypothetical protein